MRTKTINIYEFKELKPEVQEKVLEQQRNLAYEDQWTYESIMEWIKEALIEKGFPIDDKNFYWSFEGYKTNTRIGLRGNFDYKQYIDWHIENLNEKDKAEWIDAKNKYSCIFKTIGSVSINTYNDNYIDISYEDWKLEFEEVIDEDEEFLEELEEEFTNDISEEVFKTLFLEFKEWLEDKVLDTQKQYEKAMEEDLKYSLSDEALKENIEANEYEFLENGERY